MFKRILVGTAFVAGVVPAMSPAQTFGSLANFDVVNQTGLDAHGFEIELEGISKGDVLDVFGMNRNFGTASPGDVERYGIPTLNDLLDGTGKVIGARVTYQASFANGAWSATTASGVFNTPGESCWTFGNVGYPNVPCDHFGVSTRGSPSKTNYHWLVDGGGGTLVKASVGVAIPPVVFTPPSPAQPQVVAQIAAPAVIAQPVLPADRMANSFWVKIIQTQLPEAVEVHELMGGRFQDNLPVGALVHENGDVVALGEKSETEYEWQVLQFVGGNVAVDEVTKSLDLAGNPSMAIRFEFYKYMATFDDEGLVDPQPEDFRTIIDPASGKSVQVPIDAALGDYVGLQIAGFNVQAVPEPGSSVMMIGGMAALGLLSWLRARAGRSGRVEQARPLFQKNGSA